MLGKIRLLKLVGCDAHTQHYIVEIHQHIAHLLNEMRANFEIVHDRIMTALFEDIADLAHFAVHPQQLVLRKCRADAFPFILLFDFYLRRGTVIDFSMAILFSIVCYYILKRFLPKKALGILYGG